MPSTAMSSEEVGRRPPAEQILMAAIGAGQLTTERDYTAEALATGYGVTAESMTTALRYLSSDGLFDEVPSGYRLTSPPTSELRELRALRILIEVRAVRAATGTGLSDAEVRRLRVLAQATVRAAQADDPIAYIRADLEFHLAVVGLRGSRDVVEIVRLLRIRGGLHGIGPDPRSLMRVSTEEHGTLVELMADGEAGAAADLLKNHIARLDLVSPPGSGVDGSGERRTARRA